MIGQKNRFQKNKKNINKIKAIWRGYKVRRQYLIELEAIHLIQKWWRINLRKRNNIKKHNLYLEEEIKNKNRKICELERRIIELEQKLSRANYIDKTIIHERDHYIIELRKDIESYQNNIRERLDEKMRLTDTIDKLQIENGILIRQISYIRRSQSSSWFSKFFGLDTY